ncbi:MAG: ion channel [Pseudoxanthomonas sp.]
MLNELGVAMLMVVLTTLMHVTGLIVISRLLRLVPEKVGLSEHGLLRQAYASVALVLGLMTLHGLEIWAYAAVFVQLEAVADIRTAVYFSTISYAAIGYSDAAIDKSRALVAAIEGINGLVLIGWSTAYLVMIMSRVRRSAKP